MCVRVYCSECVVGAEDRYDTAMITQGRYPASRFASDCRDCVPFTVWLRFTAKTMSLGRRLWEMSEIGK